jgi:hypothetical protein
MDFEVTPRYLENFLAFPKDGNKVPPKYHQSTWHHIPEYWNLHQHCCENLRRKFVSAMPSLFVTLGKRQFLCFILVLQEYV